MLTFGGKGEDNTHTGVQRNRFSRTRDRSEQAGQSVRNLRQHKAASGVSSKDFRVHYSPQTTPQMSLSACVGGRVITRQTSEYGDVIQRCGDSEGGTDAGNIAKNLDTNNIPNMTKQDIIDNIPDDWSYTEHNGFVHIKDADGNIRIRIDPPDKVTKYPHVHVYDRDGNLLDSAGNIVDRKSPDGHIPYKAIEE